MHCFARRSAASFVMCAISPRRRSPPATVGIVCDSTTGGEFEEKLFSEMEGMLARRVRRTPMQRHIGPGDIASAWRTYKIIKELQPDVLHGHGAKGGVYARAVRLTVAGFKVSRSPPLFAAWRQPALRRSDGDRKVLLRAGAADGALHRPSAVRLGIRTARLPAQDRRTADARTACVYNGLREREFEPVPATVDAADFSISA